MGGGGDDSATGFSLQANTGVEAMRTYSKVTCTGMSIQTKSICIVGIQLAGWNTVDQTQLGEECEPREYAGGLKWQKNNVYFPRRFFLKIKISEQISKVVFI